MSDIHTAHDTHREDLLQEGLTVLGRYTHFSSTHRVTFSQVGDRLAAHLERVDGTPIPQSDTPLDPKADPPEGPDGGHPPLLPSHGQQPLGRGGRQHLHPGGL